MVYDYIIGGSGVAGCVCAYLLAKKGYKCLILEREAGLHEKICGGGVTTPAIDDLRDMGIDLYKILPRACYTIVNGCSVSTEHKIDIYPFNGRPALGMPRQMLDELLVKKAEEVGVSVKYQENIREVIQKDGHYEINGYVGKKFVCAIGAVGIKGLPETIIKKQSFAVSSIIEGDSLLRNDLYHFFCYDKNRPDKLFWIFSIGKNTWNIGLGMRYPQTGFLQDYKKVFHEYMERYFQNDYKIKREIKGSYLGHVNLGKIGPIPVDCIGDYAGTCDIRNGCGIQWAIKSAMDYVSRQ